MVHDCMSRVPAAANQAMKRFSPLEMLGGVVLGVCCAIAVKFVIWLLPFMLFVGD